MREAEIIDARWDMTHIERRREVCAAQQPTAQGIEKFIGDGGGVMPREAKLDAATGGVWREPGKLERRTGGHEVEKGGVWTG